MFDGKAAALREDFGKDSRIDHIVFDDEYGSHKFRPGLQ
jgi:hypothetical protein